MARFSLIAVAAALYGLMAGPSFAQVAPADRPAAKAPVKKAAPQKTPGPKAGCILKAGEATGVTRGFAEYEAFLIIRQVTGNWPIQSDRIEPPVYTCKSAGTGWTCKAVARVCRK